MLQWKSAPKQLNNFKLNVSVFNFNCFEIKLWPFPEQLGTNVPLGLAAETSLSRSFQVVQGNFAEFFSHALQYNCWYNNGI